MHCALGVVRSASVFVCLDVKSFVEDTDMGLEFRVCRDAFFEYFYRCLVGVLSKLCCVADNVIDIVLELSFKCPCVSTLCEGVDMCFFGGYWLAVEWTSGVDGCSVSVCLPSSRAVETCGESFNPQFTLEYLERWLGPRTGGLGPWGWL